MTEAAAAAAAGPAADAILKIRDLKTCFHTRYGVVTAVDGVSLEVAPGECLGVVGESGSGKSVPFASVMGLVKAPGRIDAGSIRFPGRGLVGLGDEVGRAPCRERVWKEVKISG